MPMQGRLAVRWDMRQGHFGLRSTVGGWLTLAGGRQAPLGTSHHAQPILWKQLLHKKLTELSKKIGRPDDEINKTHRQSVDNTPDVLIKQQLSLQRGKLISSKTSNIFLHCD